ncbi:MAG: Hsp20/alpha crystallin family protein, partial [Persicimonas sp.]
MSEQQDITIREKEELSKEEGTRPGRYFKPAADIFETEDALHVVADVPGANPENFDIDVRDNVLTINAHTDPVEERWKPVYGEYETGHFYRRFRLGQQIDQSKITANVND